MLLLNPIESNFNNLIRLTIITIITIRYPMMAKNLLRFHINNLFVSYLSPFFPGVALISVFFPFPAYTDVMFLLSILGLLSSPLYRMSNRLPFLKFFSILPITSVTSTKLIQSVSVFTHNR